MNKKILLGSIIAVAVLIGVSFTSVVGYKSVASDVKASPLFNIRTNRAIDEESGELSCEYVGKGEESSLSIPIRDNRIGLIKKFVSIISNIEEKTHNRLIDYLIKWKHQNNRIKSDYILNEVEITDTPSWDVVCTIDGEWFVGCYLLEIFLYFMDLIGIFLALFCYVMTLYWTCGNDCTWDYGLLLGSLIKDSSG